MEHCGDNINGPALLAQSRKIGLKQEEPEFQRQSVGILLSTPPEGPNNFGELGFTDSRSE